MSCVLKWYSPFVHSANRDSDYRLRLIDPLIPKLLEDFPALMFTGPRASGKTTTAARYAASVVHLDRPLEAAAFQADADVALRQLPEPILLDEWQAVPEVLGAVKRAVDTERRPARFLLTGSVQANLRETTWPGTGRVIQLPVYGMTVGEQAGGLAPTSLLDRLRAGEEPTLPKERPDLRGYVDLALKSGFPEPALFLDNQARTRWLQGYVDQLVTRDATGIEPGRDPARLRRYFEAYALNTAGIVSDATLFEAADINRKTAAAYEGLLNNLFIAQSLPAWTSNRLKRLSLAYKRYLVDAALMAVLLHADALAFFRDGGLLGRLMDTFVLSQLRPLLEISRDRPRLYHLREAHGRQEIDVIADFGAQGIIAFEIKVDSAPGPDSSRHLRWLRDRLGKGFICGVVFHTGPTMFKSSDRILAMPICALWG